MARQSAPLYALDLDGKSESQLIRTFSMFAATIKGVLGIVGKDYKPFHNDELADFCEALSESGQVQIESAGSIRGGSKIWFLLKGESFDIRNGDEISPYICVSNGHDGGTALRITPTTVRVVCSNTLHMVVPRREREAGRAKFGQAAYVSFHIGDLKKKVEEAKHALAVYGKSLETTQGLITQMSAKQIKSEQFKAFFLEAYARDFGGIPTEPKTDSEQKKRDKALEAFRQVESRFNAEKKIAGTSLWNAFNAYSGWLQNDRGLNYKDPVVKSERSMNAKLFGTDSDRTSKAFDQALSLVG
ncbi:MAG: DUF932 domain-containing protein [Pirellulaceae bacterium]